MVKLKREKNNYSGTAFDRITLQKFKDITNKGLEHDVVKAVQDGLCRDLHNLDRPDIGLEQINAIKSVGTYFNSLQTQSVNDHLVLLESLSFLFVKCKAKHPIRRALASIFQGFSEQFQVPAVTFLCQRLQNELAVSDNVHVHSEKISQDFSSDHFLKHVSTIMAFMENFPLGKTVIARCTNEVISILHQGLTREMILLRNTASFDGQTSATINCLSALKATVAVLQCGKPSEKNQTKTNSIRFSDNAVQILLDMLKKCLLIINDSSYLLDCRNTAGVTVVSILQSLLSVDALRNAVNKLFIGHGPGNSEKMGQTSYENKVISGASVKGGPVEATESSVPGGAIKNGLTESAELRVFGDEVVKKGPTESTESGVSVDGDAKNGLHESSTIANSDVKGGLLVNCIESEVFCILEDNLRNGHHSSSSRLVVCHGLVTKLDPTVLHGQSCNCQTVSDASEQSRDVTKQLDDLTLGTKPLANASKHTGVFSGKLLNSILEICSAVNEKGATVFAFKTLYCWSVEALNHCKKLDGSNDTAELALYSPDGENTSRIVETLNSYLDHSIDAVRHQVRNSLENIIRIINLFPDSAKHVQDLLKNWLKGSLRVRSNCMALCCLINYVEIDVIIEMKRSFPYDLLDCLDDANLGSHICDLYVKSASKHKSEIKDFESGFSDWVSIWCKPVFASLSTTDRLKRSAIVDYIAPGLLIAYPNLIRFIISESRNPDTGKDYVVTAVVFLAKARTLKECAKVKLSEDESDPDRLGLWHGLITMTSMRICLCHSDEQVRIEALALICESNKITEPLREQDLELLRFFIPLSMTSQSPQCRNQFVCSMKKAFSRMVERSKMVAKRISDLKARPENGINSVDGEAIDLCSNEISRYDAFSVWLFEFLLDCLHPNASFTRRNSALEIMQAILKVLNASDQSQGCFAALLTKVFTELGIRTVIGCLFDSFDLNRSLANQILSILPRDLFTFGRDEILRMFDETLSMACSSQSDSTNTAPYFIKLFTSENFQKAVTVALPDAFPECREYADAAKCRYNVQLIIARILLNRLDEQVKIAEGNLLNAAVNAPLHGTLHCIRVLLSSVALTDVRNRSSWATLLHQLIVLCFKVANIAGPVVSSSAPEGHVIPESADHNVLASQMIEELSDESTRLANNDVESQANLSQLLLACCWRSMKEIVLLLGEVASSAPVSDATVASDTFDLKDVSYISSKMTIRLSDVHISQTNDAGLNDTTSFISCNTVIDIGHLFINILLSSRHIGAFELAYPGFVKVCNTLWRSEIPALKDLPSKWIGDLLVNLKQSDSTQIFCATRRSAGIPFFISAICSTEPGIPRRKTFNKVMEVLTELCQNASTVVDDTKNGLEKAKKVIGLNVLRAMYKDSKFGEDVFQFVSDGFIIAINGFSSNIWAIRNACTLLFSALMARVFGLKKSVMSGTEFFSRFSPLYQFLVNEMRKITEIDSKLRNQVQLHPSVFPVLFLLSHLYPSSLDGNDTKMSLASFIPFINRCSDSGVYKIRAMAADALVSVVTPNQLVDVLNEVIESILLSNTREAVSQNKINGCLMKIRGLLKGKATNASVSSSLRHDIITGPLLRLNQLTWLLSRDNFCSLNKALLLQIINENIFTIPGEEESSFSTNQQLLLSSLKRDSLACCLEELGIASLSTQDGDNEIDRNQMKMIGHELVRKQCIMVIKNLINHPRHLEIIADESMSSKLDVSSLVQLLLTNDHDVHQSLLSLLENAQLISLQNEAALKVLQTRLLKGEEDLDCLSGICRMLAKIPGKAGFPWTLANETQYRCEEVWNILKEKLHNNRKRENFRSSVQKFCVVIVSDILQQIQSENVSNFCKSKLECLEEIFNLVIESCRPEENTQCRKMAAEVIGSDVFLNVATVACSRKFLFGDILFGYWRCVIHLLQDEEAEIRSLVASKIFSFIIANNHTDLEPIFTDVPSDYFVQPSLVLEMTIQLVSQMYSRVYPAELFEFLFTLVIGKARPGLEIAQRCMPNCASITDACLNAKENAKLEEIDLLLSQVIMQVNTGEKSKVRSAEVALGSKGQMEVGTQLSGIVDTKMASDASMDEKVFERVSNHFLGKNALSSKSQDATVIFEQGEANVYVETISIGHLAFLELQNLLVTQKISSVTINSHFIVHIWSTLRAWIHDVKTFFSKDNFRNSCEVLMGCYILCCVGENGCKSPFKEGMKLFCKHVDDGKALEHEFGCTALYNHFKNIRILLEI